MVRWIYAQVPEALDGERVRHLVIDTFNSVIRYEADSSLAANEAVSALNAAEGV